ncbi:MAG TPA: hypothetical protein VJY39_02340 [Acidisphaera sp.]|nr:hypothetical protein [Acidisphaera sp.]
MRSTRLIRIAAEAEAIRIRQLTRRQITRVVMGAVALIFLAAALASAHAAAYFALRNSVAPVYAALIIVGADVVLCAIFAMFAARSSPGSVEREALEVRRQALVQLGESVALWTVLTPLVRFLPRQSLYTLLLAALTARHLTGGGR